MESVVLKRTTTIIDSSHSWKRFKFSLTICDDLLIETLHYGNRRQLAQLEEIGRRFHRFIVKCFSKQPFLILNLDCSVEEDIIRFSKILSTPTGIDQERYRLRRRKVNGVSITRPGLSDDEMQKSVLFKTNAEIGELPSYLHITEVSMNSFQRCIVEFLPLLRQFSLNFYECKFWLFIYIGDDTDDSNYFHTTAEFLTCFEEQMLPLLEGSCSCIRFGLNICSNQNDAMPLIATLLKFPPIQASRYVSFEICGEFDASTQHSLDIDSITNVLVKPMKYFMRKEKGMNQIAMWCQCVYIEICKEELRISPDSIAELIETLKTQLFTSEVAYLPFNFKLVLKMKLGEFNEHSENIKTGQKLSIRRRSMNNGRTELTIAKRLISNKHKT